MPRFSGIGRRCVVERCRGVATGDAIARRDSIGGDQDRANAAKTTARPRRRSAAAAMSRRSDATSARVHRRRPPAALHHGGPAGPSVRGLDVGAEALQVRDQRDDSLSLEAGGPPCSTISPRDLSAPARAPAAAAFASTARRTARRASPSRRRARWMPPKSSVVARQMHGYAGMIEPRRDVERGSSMWRTCQRSGYLPPSRCEIRPDAARAPLERMVVDELAGLRVLAVALGLGAERPDHLRVAVVAALADVDVAAGELERRVRLARSRCVGTFERIRNVGMISNSDATTHRDDVTQHRERAAACAPTRGASRPRRRTQLIAERTMSGTRGIDDLSARARRTARERRGLDAPARRSSAGRVRHVMSMLYEAQHARPAM